MSFTTGVRVRFAHVDAGQIVFFPRYAEMFQGAMQDFMAGHVGVSVAELLRVRNLGTPVVRLEITYHKASRLGDWLDIALSVKAIGRSSLQMDCRFLCAGEARVVLSATLVLTDMSLMKSVAWPDDLRARLLAE
jgi:4-hydroxybenzoyl-CoA thioesterase